MAWTFVRWMRSGLAAALGDAPAAPPADQRATLAVAVEVAASGLAPRTTAIDLAVLGPGDVTGIDARQVVRRYPEPGTLDLEPSYFAHVEFDRHDLPWLFTPFGPDAAGNLRPWLALVVVALGDGARLEATLPLPSLTLQGAERATLPEVAELHRWAHLQVTGSMAEGLERIARDEPARVVSRLVCPRVLQPRTAYVACVVPTFRAGALTGLGQPVAAGTPRDAWTAADTTVVLPVYHHWEFSTGGDGDFRTLVSRLQPRASLPGVGTRPLDVSRPGFGLAARPAAAPVPIGGVLKAAPPAPAPVDAALAAVLPGLLSRSDALGPPIYGRWHAAVASVDPARVPARWVDTLNLDPRYRVAAGLGTRVVQEHQEDLMAAVWEQFGEILRANQLLRQAQAAVAASERVLARHLAPLPDAALLALTGPALGRVRAPGAAPGRPGPTLRAAVAASCLPLLALSGSFRRICRVHGPVERRMRRRWTASGFPDLAPPPAFVPDALVGTLSTGGLNLAPAAPPDGAVRLPRRLGYRWRSGRPPAKPPYLDPKQPAPGPLDRLAASLGTLARRATAPRCRPLDVAAAADTLRQALEPDVAIVDRVLQQVTLPASARVKLTRRLDAILAAPQIPTPMVGPLLELDPTWLLPGLERVPANSVTLLEPDTAFIASYLVGLNHEMGRELLWRGFPTDQRGTVFARFWDRRGAVSTPADPVPPQDIPAIHGWDPAAALGATLESVGGAAGGPTVLLVRGDLLQRYPRVTVYAQRARWVRDARGAIVVDGDLARREPVPLATGADWTAHTRFPQFGQRVGADIAFHGFALGTPAMRGLDRRSLPATAGDDSAGWYVVFQEQPTQPRFGPMSPPPAAGESAERLAERLVQPAFRLFVHASDLIVA